MRAQKILLAALLFGMAFLLKSCIDREKYAPRPYLRPLEIVKLSDKDYLHISYLNDDKGGYIPCNGYIRIEGNEAAVFDTPLNDSISEQLIDYIKKDLNAEIKAVVVSHFHKDAAGGIKAFVDASIPSYASEDTAARMNGNSITITNTISESKKFSLGSIVVDNRYFGPAHSQGDIVSFIAADSTLFGGCAVKPINGNRGNLADASPAEWAITIQKVKEAYPAVKMIIPGHGATGDSFLLDYTVELFADDALR